MTCAAELEACIRRGGVAVFGADTVYGLACDPASETAVRRLYEIKGRDEGKPAAVMFFSVAAATGVLGGAGEHTRAALERLLPGPLTVLLPNPTGRFPLACGPDPSTLGLRVPDLPDLAAVKLPVLQSSANPAGGADARRLEDVPEPIRDAADLVLDAGELPGTASTVVDLRGYEAGGEWAVLREGALGTDALARALA